MRARADQIRDTIIARVLDAADPARAVDEHWPSDLDDPRRVVIAGIGKASIAMARAGAAWLGPSVGGVVICPVDAGICPLPSSLAVYHADHPIPTQRNLDAARSVASCVAGLHRDQTLVLMISGGGSAHLCAPWPGLTLGDLASVTADLLRSGATIEQLNMVRKHCEQLKGGRLGAMAVAAGATVRVLVLSDVPGDRLDAIASGPAAADPTTYAQALAVLDETGCTDEHRAIAAHLRRGAQGGLAETPKPGDPIFAHIEHTIIANNQTAVDAAVRACEQLGLGVEQQRAGVRGEACAVGTELGRAIARVSRSSSTPSAIVWGGETTVTVGGVSGVGGRCQEAALAAAIALADHPGCGVLTLATDGVDGPTDAAGALVTGVTCQQALHAGVDLKRALTTHDSHAVLDRLGALIRTGPTGTNLNDVMVAWSAGRD